MIPNETTKPKRIFITGGTGFVGKPLVKLLEKNEHKLLLLVRSPEKYRRFFDTRKTKLVRGDLSNFKTWTNVVSKFKPDIAIHLAWEGIPDFSPAMCIKNLKFGVDLYEFLGNIGCKTVITTGSCWEYGNANGKVSEDSSILPHNAIVASKDALHNLGQELAKEYSQSFIWLRLFYVYGPDQKPSSLIPHLINFVRKGVKPEIKNPNVGHDFIFVNDIAEAISQLIIKNPKGDNVYNVGYGKLVGVAEIANLVYRKKVLSPGHPSGFYANISRIKKLGWNPKISIKEGIKKTMLLEKN